MSCCGHCIYEANEDSCLLGDVGILCTVVPCFFAPANIAVSGSRAEKISSVHLACVCFSSCLHEFRLVFGLQQFKYHISECHLKNFTWIGPLSLDHDLVSVINFGNFFTLVSLNIIPTAVFLLQLCLCWLICHCSLVLRCIIHCFKKIFFTPP